MIDSILSFSLKNKLIIGILTLLMVAWGAYNFTKLPIDAVPDITNNQVQVITISTSLSPQEVEQFITFPVEMAMANLQGVTEIRSISRFGLSVVTIVFKDNIDPYLARQMVNEQITIAENDIPEGIGKPEMMPVTTGLGEIYQYVLEPLPGYEEDYDPMELRTIQDWIVKRQLSGIPGIVEVSSFGGYLKQYQVTVKPRTLIGMDLTLMEIFDALEANNQNTGGSYIEKGPNAYYIRAEGLIKDKEDIENIVIKNINEVPILIRDVADVSLDWPTRFGAMTKDGKGETVGGITLMLRGANSAEVISSVKERMERVREVLPPGLTIHPYLDRSVLISKTINTVTKNLVEGGLIVILVLMLLVGNLRASLIVASVIPLSMLFAFSMMNLFGVSANLMSLGAIDFGLIVDGSVIVVEGIIHRLEQKYKDRRLDSTELEKNILGAAKRVSKSAVFGVTIILIVYIPIFAFTGIEGKMFKPMAQTVSFALLGALILSLTYVPVMAALFFKKDIRRKENVSDKIVSFLNRAHQPVLRWSLSHKWLMIIIVSVVFLGTLVQFNRMGAEFIPTLEEGDLAAQMSLAPGSSLSESIATSTKAEKILLKQFPEVKEVVSKIGTAEVPTDPMAMEDADIMIILKDKKEWTSATTRDELAEKMKEVLDVLPGASFEFTQPIQLRFNELMTGVKSDVAVKIYGEDLDSLYQYATNAAALIYDVPGAGDVKVEQVTGLPQLVVRYKRDKLAQYSLTINEINRIIRAAFAGESTGVIFEGERRFDLVVRLQEDFRKNINSLKNLRVNRPSDQLVLLEQVADITFETGPMQISRDDTKRRITIGINIRNRDIQSFVDEIEGILNSSLDLPAGYYVTYGGQFENLQDARRSSSIAVPVALGAILILLYFAFNSLKQAIMIFTAIPLATVGGIWALFIRGMPFSISAGVGFIALFGVAVLNGIVLLSYYNYLEKEGVKDLYHRVLEGTRVRLRPVIMTAAVAALGFIPMATSTAAGAEVQRPLATVVIGGLITATFLTLVVLPVIYVLFQGKRKTNGKKAGLTIAVLIPLLMLGLTSRPQDARQTLTMEQAVQYALDNNLDLKNAAMSVEAARKARKSAVDIPFPEFELVRGQINSSILDNHYSISQQLNFPTVYSAQKKILNTTEELAWNNARLMAMKVTWDVKSAYLNWSMLAGKREILLIQDSIYEEFRHAATLQYEVGEVNKLAKLMAETKTMAMNKLLFDVEADMAYVEKELLRLMNLEGEYVPAKEFPQRLIPVMINDSSWMAGNPSLENWQTQSEIFNAMKSKEQMLLLPDIKLGYFNQSIDAQTGFQGWMVGVSVPLWFWSQRGKIQSASIGQDIALNNLKSERLRLSVRVDQLYELLNKYDHALDIFDDFALSQADEIASSAITSYRAGEIDYIEYVQNISLAFEIRLQYLDALNDYNQTVLELDYYLNRQ
jgi:cobalt-zinc-cadmium resistance protein CzcA